jgi:hypothetical protein
VDVRERGDDLVHHAIGKVLLLGVAAQIGKGQNGDRGPVRQRERGLGRCSRLPGDRRRDPEDADRPGDVLDLLLAHVLEGQVELVPHLVADLARDAKPAGFCKRFEPSRDVHAIAVDVVAVDDDVADVDANPEDDPPVLRDTGIPSHHAVLNCHSAGDRIHHTWKLDEDAVSGGLHHSAVMPRNGGIGEFSADGLQIAQRADLIDTHKAAVANDVACEDRGKPSLNGCLIWHVCRLPSDNISIVAGMRRASGRQDI